MATTRARNWVPVAILRSPLHRILSGKRLLLTFTGRTSGTRYATPVNYRQRGQTLLITTDSRWWRNLDGGAPVELHLRGSQVTAHAMAVLQPAEIAEGLTALIRDHPPYGRWAHVTSDSTGQASPMQLMCTLKSPAAGCWCACGCPATPPRNDTDEQTNASSQARHRPRTA